jgi:hypothetical protein
MKNIKLTDNITRRSLFVSIVRNIVLLILGVFAGFTILKKSSASANRQCTGNGLCDGCSIFGSCNLPKAKAAKTLQSGIK